MTVRRQRGFAVLLVMSMAALLALLGTKLTAAGRTEAQIARNLRDAAEAEAAADGAIAEALFHLQATGPQGWGVDGRVHRFQVGAAAVEVRLESETGRLNPNTAPVAVLASLLRQIGLAPDAAGKLAGAIFDWHTQGSLSVAGGTKEAAYRAAGRTNGPTGRPFETVGELELVLGMTPQILARLRPLLSVYNEAGVDARFASPELRTALSAAGLGFDTPDPTNTVLAATAIALLPSGARATRRAVIQPRRSGDGTPFRILTWENPDL